MNGIETPVASIPELIVKKRDGGRLTNKEITKFIHAVCNKEIQDSQIGAMLMAIFLRGMDEAETVELTRAMIESGEVLTWPRHWQSSMVDKHSTGGVGDKVSLPLAPALAACGVKVPMISGRALGITGGTLDKLESIPGFTVFQSPANVRSILENVGCCIVGQTESLVPADRILYAMRDVTGTVESNPLIAGSIVSKKAAESLNTLVLDVKCGKGANLKTMEQALSLSNAMVKIGKGLGVNTTAVITDMNTPLGRNIGNSLEVIESIECLHGEGPPNLRYVVTVLGGIVLHNAGKAASQQEGAAMIAEKLDNGEALSKWRQMLEHQGVCTRVADGLCERGADMSIWLPTAPRKQQLRAHESGYVADINALTCGQVSKNLGAGRSFAGQAVDHAVGLQLHLQVGDCVEKGQVWLTVHHRNDLSINVVAELEDAIAIQSEPPENASCESLIKQIIQ